MQNVEINVRRHPDQISEESYDKNNEYENSLEDG